MYVCVYVYTIYIYICIHTHPKHTPKLLQQQFNTYFWKTSTPKDRIVKQTMKRCYNHYATIITHA